MGEYNTYGELPMDGMLAGKSRVLLGINDVGDKFNYARYHI